MEQFRPTIDEALEDCERRHVEQMYGINVSKPPETLAQLIAMVADSRNTECEVSAVIDSMLTLIRASSDPDSLVRQLPYDAQTGDLMFVLLDNPNIEER